MDSEKSGSSGVKNKQTREQEKQRRRHLTKSTSHDQGGGGSTGSQAPVFKPVEKKDSELHKITLNVLGDYNRYKNAMEWGKQTSYFGVADATPSTPIQGSKYSPFDSEFRAASSRGSPSSSSGVSSGSKTMSRHQVAELPGSQPYYKKDKTRTKLHQKHSSSKMDASSQRSPSNLATSVKSNKEKEMKRPSNSSSRVTADGSTETAQATNTLKSKQKKVRPYKPQVTGSVPAPSQSRSNPQSSSLFDFNTPTVGGASSNALTIQRTLSSSSVTSTSPSKPKLLSSDRSNSFNSTPTSRHCDGHVTSSHSVTSHKHKKQASVQPTAGSVSQKACEEEQKATSRVVSIKRTSSLEFIKHPQSWEKNVANDVLPLEGGEVTKDDPVALQNNGKSSGKKKEKKPRKKLKKDKEMDAVTAERKMATSAGGVMLTSPTVVSDMGLFNTTESHVTLKSSAQTKTEVMSMPSLKSRPSDLRFTLTTSSVTSAPQQSAVDVATSGAGPDDVSQDPGDVQSMLQEMMKPLDHSYSLVTPIPTPVKARPFVFPTERHSSSGGGRSSSELAVFKKPSSADSSHEGIMQGAAAHLHKLSTSSSDEESDPDSKFQMAVENAVSMLDYNLAEESQPQRDAPKRPDSPTLSVSSSSSSSGESSSDSGDSSSEGEGEGEGEESESNITPMLEKLHRHAQLSGEAITPLKKTPPRSGLMSVSSFLSPIADESANLSPAKPTGRSNASSILTHSDSSMLTSQASTGFNPTLTSGAITIPSIPVSIMSDSSDSDSGSESDSESSDSESSGEEDNVSSRTDSGLKRTSVQSEEVMPAPPPFGSSTGFWDETYDLFGATSQVGDHESKHVEQLTQNCRDEPMEIASTSHSSSDKQSSRIGKKRKHSSGSQFSLHKAQKLMNSDVEQQIQDEPMEMGVSASTRHSVSDKQRSRVGKKHKQSSGSQLSLHKAQKLMNMVHLSSDAEDGETLNQKPPHVMATGSSEGKGKRNLSDSEMSEGDEEEGEIPSEEEDMGTKPLPRHQTIEAGIDTQVENNSANFSRPDQGKANPSLSTVIKQEEAEEDEKEEPDSLVVSFHISNIRKLPMQKPKATVEPFYHHNTSTSKVTRRRNTVDAPGERDGDEVQSRGLSRERGDRSTYNRHREDYGRDYHRASRSHRDSSARWDRESSRDRRMYGNPEERSSRHGSGRHSGWDRDGDYHRDDYWMDSGGTHYDRGTREYERGGSRQRGETERKRGAEYFMQEARRRKHEADKIQIPGVDKAKAYMDSVPYFLRHGDAIEHERQQQNQQWVESGGEASKRKSFKMYSDTLSVVRFCQNMAGDCKPLVVICLRCQSVLLWRMFQLKQATSSQVQKELQEFFVLPKGTQSKSPYPNNFSPLPSPASVSSTASNGSGGGAFPQDPSPSCTVSVPKHIFNKASEHLAISGYLNQSFDAWKKADSMMEQCREFFLKAERKPGRLHQFSSSIPQAASWVENTLRCLR